MNDYEKRFKEDLDKIKTKEREKRFDNIVSLLVKDEHFKLWDILQNDVLESIKEVKKNNKQKKRRDLVRSLFSFIEGNTFKMKQDILIIEKNRINPKLNNGEIVLLEEKNYYVNKKGKVKSSQRYTNFIDNIKFTIDCYCKSLNIVSNVDYKCERWKNFEKSVEIRNRITHPKKLDEIDISTDELSILNDGYLYFLEITQDYLNKCIDSLDNLEV